MKSVSCWDNMICWTGWRSGARKKPGRSNCKSDQIALVHEVPEQFLCQIEANLFCNAEDTAQSIGGVFVRAHSDCVDAHLHHGVVIAAGLGHIAKIEDV